MSDNPYAYNPDDDVVDGPAAPLLTTFDPHTGRTEGDNDPASTEQDWQERAAAVERIAETYPDGGWRDIDPDPVRPYDDTVDTDE